MRPIFHPETLRIELSISEPGRSSFMMKYRVYVLSDLTAPAADGYSKVVWVSSENGKSVPLPEHVRAWFEQT
jgi:acyl-CoA thioester hydrolase